MATTAADILIRAVMQGGTGLPEDVYVNDFAFHWTGAGLPTDSNIEDAMDCVDNFYNADVGVAEVAVADHIGEAVSRSVTHELQAFRIDTGGSPVFTEPWLGPHSPITANSNLPTEVAGVLSFHGDLSGVLEESGATRPRARRRGRIFVGPLTTDAIDPGDDNPRLNATFTATLRAAATSQLIDGAVPSNWAWSVWSRAADALYPVVGGWTDNAPDIQRRRGVAASLRTVWSA